MNQKIESVIKLLTTNGPERNVSKRWLFHTGSHLDQKFKASAPYSFSDMGEFSQVRIDGQVFLWPSMAPKTGILQVLSELLTPEHPHQYLYGQTKITLDDVVLDVGACEGAFSALVTARCKQVIAVEPSRSMCKLIAELFRVRSEPCPEILNCLLGSQSARAYFAENAQNPGASRILPDPVPGAYELPVRTLDEVVESLRQKPTFIKCDAEGAEPAIFSGGRSFLSKFRPKLAITTYHNDGDFAAMQSVLQSFGYNTMGKGFLFANGVLRVQMIHAW